MLIINLCPAHKFFIKIHPSIHPSLMKPNNIQLNVQMIIKKINNAQMPPLVLEQDWLMKYGYLPPPDPSTGQLQAWTAVTHALKAMQRFAGLQDTGELGRKHTPFCSMSLFNPLAVTNLLCLPSLSPSLFLLFR